MTLFHFGSSMGVQTKRASGIFNQMAFTLQVAGVFFGCARLTRFLCFVNSWRIVGPNVCEM